MHKKTFIDYKKFLEFANKNVDDLKNIKYFAGRLYSYNTKSYCCKYLIERNAVTPNKFVEQLGFSNYHCFVNKRFSKLKEFAQTPQDVKKWYSGYFGGLIGLNDRIINKYVATGEVFEFYDYDINSAYLHALTQWLPTKFVKTMTIEEFNNLNEYDKIPYIYFFELDFKTIKTMFMKAVGQPKSIYTCFDFLSSKQEENFIVSEKRLSLINQIYFKEYTIKNVFVFERGRFAFYKNILHEYLKQKQDRDEHFKKNAMRLYGTFGQIYKYTPSKLWFEQNGDLKINSSCKINFNCSPQVAMFVSDIVAEKMFNIISNNLDCILSWCVDGFTSTKKINVKLSKRGGDWKLKQIVGIPMLLTKGGKRVIYKDIRTNKIHGSDCIIERNNNFIECVTMEHSNLHKGFVSITKEYLIEKYLTFDYRQTFRGLINQRYMYENILHEKQKIF